MADNYYRLERIDGSLLPQDLEYGDARCVITDGDLVLQRGETFSGDGIICIRLFGSAFGHPQIQQIFLEREAFDRLDEAHITFPGGWRHQQGISPHTVVRYTEDGLELTPITSEPAPRKVNPTFRGHRWSFVASQQLLPDSDAAAASERP